MPFAMVWFPGGPFLFLAAGIAWGAVYARQFHWLWRFGKEVRRFRTVQEGRMVLHYEPQLEAKSDLATLLRRCRAELDGLTDCFGFSLRGRVVVFIFASYRE